MELTSIFGNVIFASEDTKTILDLVLLAVESAANLYGADLRGASLRGADLSGADLRGASLRGADLRGASLRGADLSGANLSDASLSGASLRGASLRGADLYGNKVKSMRVYSGLYRYQVWAVVFEGGSRWVRMGCLFKTLEEWASGGGIRVSNIFEYPDDGSEKCLEREAAFEFAKAAVMRMAAAGEARAGELRTK